MRGLIQAYKVLMTRLCVSAPGRTDGISQTARLPNIIDNIKMTRNITKSIFAIPAAAPAIPVNPGIADIIATSRKTNTRFIQTITAFPRITQNHPLAAAPDTPPVKITALSPYSQGIGRPEVWDR